MVSMGIEHYNQSRVITFTLEICNALFTTIFSLGRSPKHISSEAELTFISPQRPSSR
jgi:hypothetical protein